MDSLPAVNSKIEKLDDNIEKISQLLLQDVFAPSTLYPTVDSVKAKLRQLEDEKQQCLDEKQIHLQRAANLKVAYFTVHYGNQAKDYELVVNENRVDLTFLQQTYNPRKIVCDGMPCELKPEKTEPLFVIGKQYNLRVLSFNDVDVKYTFSALGADRWNQVVSDFGIKELDSCLMLDDTAFVDPPQLLIDSLRLFSKYNTMKKESSRRFIVELFLLHALANIESPVNLVIDEETKISVKTTAPNHDKFFEYTGNIDFVIAHLKLAHIEDAAFLAFECKTFNAGDVAHTQALAAAASLLLHRKSKGRGVNKTGGPVHYCVTDGFEWVFYKLSSEGLMRSSVVEVSKFTVLQDVKLVYSWLHFLINEWLKSTSTFLENIRENISTNIESSLGTDLGVTME